MTTYVDDCDLRSHVECKIGLWEWKYDGILGLQVIGMDERRDSDTRLLYSCHSIRDELR
jgi:hypothetical protein